jgi:hypothetical protein
LIFRVREYTAFSTLMMFGAVVSPKIGEFLPNFIASYPRKQ